MAGDDRLGFLTTLGREFCEVLGELAGEANGQDAYEVFSGVLGDDFGPSSLAELDSAELARLAEECRVVLEVAGIRQHHVADIARRTLTHWPSEPHSGEDELD